MEKHHRNKKHYCHYYAQTVESLLGRVVFQVLDLPDSIPDPATERFSVTVEHPP